MKKKKKKKRVRARSAIELALKKCRIEKIGKNGSKYGPDDMHLCPIGLASFVTPVTSSLIFSLLVVLFVAIGVG